jgi:hypothetical protein
MSGTLARYVAAAMLLLPLVTRPAKGQNTEFSPEIGIYVSLNQDMRLYFLIRETSQDGIHSGLQLGSNVDLYFKPLIKLKRFTVFELDQSKSRLLTFRFGYRYAATPGGPGRCDVFFDSNYDKCSRTAFTVGSAFPIGKHFELDGSYEHQNNTGMASNKQVHVIGLALNMYFP